jgi:transposase
VGVHLDGSVGGGVSRLEVIEGPSGRRRRTKAERALNAAESLVPGTSGADVARRHGTTRWQVYDWRKKLRTGQLGVPGCVAALPMFAELVVDSGSAEAPPTTEAKSGVEIVIADVVIRAGADADEGPGPLSPQTPPDAGLHVLDDRHQVEARTADPVAQRAAVKVEPLTLEDPGLAVERQAVTELGHDDPCDQPLGRQPAGDDMLGGVRLSHGLRTPAAGVSGAPRDQHQELHKDHVEPLGDILADPGHLPTAAGALGAGGLDQPLDPGQVRRQMRAVARRLAGRLPACPGKRCLGLLLRSRQASPHSVPPSRLRTS